MAAVSFAPGVLDYTVVQGDDFVDTYTITENAAELDMSAYTLAATVNSSALPAPVPMTVDTTDAASGIVVVSLTDTQTSALTVGLHDWDFQWTDNDGKIRTVLAGTFKVIPQVT